MKKIYVVFIWILGITMAGVTQGADQDSSSFDGTIPDRLQEIVGSGVWLYVWPHGNLPLEPNGYTLQSAPIDFTKGNGGRIKPNWGMDSVYLSADKHMMITARVLEYRNLKEMKGREMTFAISPQKYWREPIRFTAFAFHDTKAASGVPSKNEANTADCYLAFRVENRLFMLEGKASGKVVDAKEAVLKFAEKIYSNYKLNL